jgi:FAD/FMN-containing dehydrogenase
MIYTRIDAAAFQHFQASLNGVLLDPSDAAYDRARRVWNGRIDRYPAVIARCADASDVIHAVQFAHAQGLAVAIRTGGHSLADHSVCDGGLVIDLSRMHNICLDLEQGTARAEAGLTTGAFLRATQACGLATPTGLFSRVGLGGLTLGGGIGGKLFLG